MMKKGKIFGSLLMTLLCVVALVSCSKDDDKNEKGKNDPSQLIVTGGVDDKADTWAELDGYLNNTDDDGNVTVAVSEYGIEVCLEDGSSEKRVAGKNLDESEFSVKVTGLTANTSYKYRAYANIGTKSAADYKYGKYKTFKTEKGSGESSDPNVLDISSGEVTANGVLFNGLYYTFDGSKATIAKADPDLTSVKLTLKVKHSGTVYDLTAIGDKAFANCTQLKSIDFTYAITSIGAYAFMGCSLLEKITLPASLKEIKAYTFYNCGKLSNVEFPTSLEKIGDYAFHETGLKYLSLPSNVTEIGKLSFWGTKIETLSLGSKLKEIPEKAFMDCHSLKSISIGSSITKLGDSSFSYCTKLEEVNLPTSLVEIGDYCFQWDQALSYIFIPKGVQKIGGAAFFYCSKLTSVSISSGIKSIDDYAFYSTPNNITMRISASTPPTLGEEAFRPINKYDNQRTLIVPSSYLSAYSSNSTYKSYFNTIKASE